MESGDDADAGQRAAHRGEREPHGEIGELRAGERAAHPGARRRLSREWQRRLAVPAERGD